MVYGAYDIGLRVEMEKKEELKHLISWRIRRLDRVRSTNTNIVVELKS
jgi:hypothetical protein